MAFKFVHTADIHLDSPLKSLALRDADLAELVSSATRSTLSRIVDLCIAESVQALLIAGDLYDGSQTSMKTARFLAQELERLATVGIPVFLIRGNHDATSKITRELTLPPSVTVFPNKATVVETQWNGHPVAVHGISFAQPHAPNSLLDKFAPPVEGHFNLGLLHTSLGGALGHDPYAPCALSELQQTAFNYWALGHIHKRDAHTGPTTVVMPGIPQGRDIGEDGPKSVTLVHVSDDATLTLEERNVSLAQFERLPIDCTNLSDWPELVDHLKHALRSARQNHSENNLIVRPVLEGKTPLAWRAKRDADLLRSEAMNMAKQLEMLWIDKIEIALQPNEADSPGGAIGDMIALLSKDTLRADDPAVQDEADRILKQLPRELRGLWGQSETDVSQTLQAAMKEGALDILALIEESEG